MHRSSVFLGVIASVLLVGVAHAQEQGRPRKLAPGVIKMIPIELMPRDMASLPMKMPGVDAPVYDPSTIPVEDTLRGHSDHVILYRDEIWEYEFSFLGLRQAKLRVPSPDGKEELRNVWYLVFRIRNTGASMAFSKPPAIVDFKRISPELKTNVPVPRDKIDFRPRLTLEGSVAQNGKYERVTYADVINPILVEQIRQIEDPNQKLLDTQQMAKMQIPMAKTDSDPGVWGVAIWEDVDPRIDFVSVYVRGLSNAYRLNSEMEKPSRLKTLQLNFWRPGDVVGERRDDVEYGIPLVDDPKKQALICERYRLPGPLLRGYQIRDDAKRNVLLVEADPKFDLKTFKSPLVPVLNTGKMPAGILEAFENSGITIDQNVALKTVIEGRKWTFSDGGNDYVIALEPQYWEPVFGRIRFIKSVDHAWIYR